MTVALSTPSLSGAASVLQARDLLVSQVVESSPILHVEPAPRRQALMKCKESLFMHHRSLATIAVMPVHPVVLEHR